jgi:hypothetical protein
MDMTADGQSPRELGRMMILGQGAASAGVSVPPTPTTATTPSATTMANGGKEPEFIFSPRPCSPPLLETTTRTFGELYHALKMEG